VEITGLGLSPTETATITIIFAVFESRSAIPIYRKHAIKKCFLQVDCIIIKQVALFEFYDSNKPCLENETLPKAFNNESLAHFAQFIYATKEGTSYFV
jgi:hypothetical protein